MDDFLFKLPKIELHAHLNGSLNIASICELGILLYGENTQEFLQLSQHFINCDAMDLSSCFHKFKFMHQLTETQRGLQLATQMVIRDFAADHVIYLELRTTPKSNATMSKRKYLLCVLEAIEQARQKHYDISVKLLPSIDRAQTPEDAADTLELVLQLRSQYPGIIIGMDFSGNPAIGEFASFIPVLTKAREHGLKLALHCAEIDNPAEVAEMLAFGMDRCGHGTFLSDNQQQVLKELNIPIECCLTSNVKCGTVASYEKHHFLRLLKANKHVVVCTDDCGIFNTTLTRELLIAAQTYGLQRADIYELSFNGVTHSFTSAAEKTKLRLKIDVYFKNCVL